MKNSKKDLAHLERIIEHLWADEEEDYEGGTDHIFYDVYSLAIVINHPWAKEYEKQTQKLAHKIESGHEDIYDFINEHIFKATAFSQLCLYLLAYEI